MGEFSDFFVVPKSEIAAAARSGVNSKKWPYFGMKWVFPHHLACLHAHLNQVPLADATRQFQADVIDEIGAKSYDERDPADREDWMDGYFVSVFPDRLVSALAAMDEAQRSNVAIEWKTLLVTAGEPAFINTALILDGLCPLAVKAAETGQLMILSQPGE